MPKITTVGRLKLDRMIPPEFGPIDRSLNSKEVSALLTRIAKERPDIYPELLKKLTNFGFESAHTYGGVASIHLNDLRLPPELSAMRRDLKRRLYSISQRKDITPAEKNKLIISTVKKATPEIDKAVMQVLGDSTRNNSFGFLVSTGSKGKPQQLRQMVFGDLLTVDSKMRDIPYATLRSYGEGISPLQYWTASHGGRYGYIQVQKATADSGYFSKQTRSVALRQKITADDCGRARPYIMDCDDDNAVGALLFKAYKGKSGKVYPANTILTEQILDDLSGNIQTRSAICCGMADGVCSKCAGVRESGRLPDIGDAIGLNGINASNEQISQAGLSSKHSGGESVSANRVKRGFAAIEQFINMPENFVGGAAIASKSGKISAIEPAPQGGTNIKIGDTTVYVPAGFEPTVKVGTHVEAGDLISEGMPNVGAITEYKGIGIGRKAFVDSLYDLLQTSGSALPKKQLEPFARAYINRVEITDPDGLQGWLYGDIADYAKIEAKWKPREGSMDVRPTHAIGKYLEYPQLHYTIGTPITRAVADDLEKAGISKITVHSTEAPFKPYIQSAKQFAAKDEDWITALSGEGLTKSFIEHAQRGSIAKKQGTSYYPDLAFVGTMDEKPLTV